MEIKRDEETRRAILEAAGRTFQKWGLHKTTMEDIAHEAGKGKSSLYYYYQSKDEIFDTLIRVEIGSLLARAKASVQMVPSAKEKLKQYFIASLTEIKNTATIYDIVRREVRGNPRFIEKVRIMFEESELRFLKDILTLGVETKEFTFADGDELDTAARVVLELVRAMELQLFLENYNSKHVDMAARLIANGI
ncbi:MAG: TetR/AcrR family transcriptional regulator [Bacteroidetes bacterium]|nr:TetR/AcrR family transcriptional regulator [Bacteroidota bacterium]